MTKDQVKLVMMRIDLDREMDRVERQRIKRRIAKLERKVKGRDPRAFVGHTIGGIPAEKRDAWALKKCTTAILDELDPMD